MDKPTFSIIIPAHNRIKTLNRAIGSLINQTYDPNLFEIIVVDDGSTDQTAEVLEQTIKAYAQKPDIIVHKFPENRGRIAARNKGMELASKEWICWLDSDDEYLSTYLQICAEAVQKNPEASIFNFGAVVFDEQNFRSWLRDAFLPGVRENGRGHDVFKSGGIGTGSFIFKKGLIAEVGFLPEARTPYGNDNSFPALATKNWPELGALYGQNPDGAWLPFGNPWGDDWLYFFLLTRNHISTPLPIHLYLQHLRH